MIKYWQLLDSITDKQIAQLLSADISVSVDADYEEIGIMYPNTAQYKKIQTVHISTVSEIQEAFLLLMFDSNKLKQVRTEYDSKYL